MSMHETGGPMFLAVNIAMLTLAVVAGTIGTFHSAAASSPRTKEWPSLHSPLAHTVDNILITSIVDNILTTFTTITTFTNDQATNRQADQHYCDKSCLHYFVFN